MTIKSTPDHPFFVDGKFWCSTNPQLTAKNCGIKVQEIMVGDHCIIYQQGHMSVLTVKAIKQLNKTTVTYNLPGLKLTNYFANYLLVSNEGKPEI